MKSRRREAPQKIISIMTLNQTDWDLWPLLLMNNQNQVPRWRVEGNLTCDSLCYRRSRHTRTGSNHSTITGLQVDHSLAGLCLCTVGPLRDANSGIRRGTRYGRTDSRPLLASGAIQLMQMQKLCNLNARLILKSPPLACLMCNTPTNDTVSNSGTGWCKYCAQIKQPKMRKGHKNKQAIFTPQRRRIRFWKVEGVHKSIVTQPI